MGHGPACDGPDRGGLFRSGDGQLSQPRFLPPQPLEQPHENGALAADGAVRRGIDDSDCSKDIQLAGVVGVGGGYRR